MEDKKKACEEFFNIQFANAMCALSKKAPYAKFGPFVIKYEPEECGFFTEVKWRAYLFEAGECFKTLKQGVNPIGKLTPIFEQKFDYMPFAQEIWYKYGDQLYTEFDKWVSVAQAASRR